uniref:Phosphatase tensin-type domain-containing protein n=1 Tax=Parastrongyloides trichosuri TaxID=131310 RepID=A0A0N4Z354_PARTI
MSCTSTNSFVENCNYGSISTLSEISEVESNRSVIKELENNHKQGMEIGKCNSLMITSNISKISSKEMKNDNISPSSSLQNINPLSYSSSNDIRKRNGSKSSFQSTITSSGIATLSNCSTNDLSNSCLINFNNESSSPHTLIETAIKEESFFPSDEVLDEKSLPPKKEIINIFGGGVVKSQKIYKNDIDLKKETKMRISSTSNSQTSGKMCNPLKKIVSQNRRRYINDGFNLDLTYITDRIIAMGYPAEDSEKLYRNSMNETKRFLEHYHSKHYLVFNLRGQYIYDEKNFDNRVRIFEMTDHHPPRLELMAPFCREVHKYLLEDPKNIVAVHCKAGKGRTGVMICAYLVYINFYLSPRKNMEYYSILRTMDNKGVTIPSQRRYVYYFHHLRQKQLNYIPLRVELVGIYIERPPKSDTKVTKGELKIRVANGDIEVFCGKGLSFTNKKAEEEEEMWRMYGLSVGEDNYNPNDPQNNKDIISRRCYGWTISKENKRVFLEGDIRVDLFREPQLKLIGYKKKDIKIGHIWFSTMFTCPGFCDGNYIHGDELYAYPGNKSDLVKEVKKPILKNYKGKELEQKSLSTSSIPQTNTTGECENKNKICGFVPESQKQASKISVSLNKMKQKFSQTRKSLPETNTRVNESSAKNFSTCDSNVEYIRELEVDKPPGLNLHCPEESLKLIYPGNHRPPRETINEILKEAYDKNLIVDTYNERRLSTVNSGKLIPKAPEGEPNGDGPYCLKRKNDEHVQIYNVIEIDRAYKNKSIDDGFKIIIVTRCIDTENKEEVELAEKFVNETYKKQKERDIRKSKHIRKASSSNVNRENMYGTFNDNFDKKDFEDQIFKNDPRLDDSQQRKYFFRQRIDSLSHHPEIHYHCPLKNYSSIECINGTCKNKGNVTCENKNYNVSPTNDEKKGNEKYVNNIKNEENTKNERSNIFYDDEDEVCCEFENNYDICIHKNGRTRTMIPATAVEQFGTPKPNFSSPLQTPRNSGNYESDDRFIKYLSDKEHQVSQEKECLPKNSLSSIRSSIGSQIVIEEINSSESSWATSSSCSSITSAADPLCESESLDKSEDEYVSGDITPNRVVDDE